MLTQRPRLTSTFVFALLLVISLPAALHTYAGIGIRTIRTGSMEPGMQPGDIAVVRATGASVLRTGDIALLFHPSDGQVEAHRVVTIVARENGYDVVTKGDANPQPDPQILLPRYAAVERVAFVIPKAGLAIAEFGSPVALGGLCALGLMVLIAFEIHDRRRRSSSETETVRSA